MILSFTLSTLRTIKEKNPDYVDIGLGFILMGLIESFILIMMTFIIKGVLSI